MQLFSLQFKDAHLEKQYIKGYCERFRIPNRTSLIISLFMYTIFAVIDYMYNDMQNSQIHILRFLITLPFGITILILSFIPLFQKYIRKLYTILIIIAGISISYVVLHQHALLSASLLGLIVFQIFSFNLIRITFIQSLILNICLLAVSILYVIINSNNYESESFIIFYFLIISLFFSGYAGYFFELTDRKNFRIQYELLQKNQSYHTLQIELEHIVKERTTQLEAANTALQRAKQKAEESNAIKSEFLATISHEIRTPLTSILGFSQLIAQAKSSPEKQQKYVALLEESTEKLLQIITDILTLAEIETNRLETATCTIHTENFSREIERIAHDMLQRHKKNLQFHIQHEGTKPCIISIGKHDLITILQHILDNAVKYTPEGEFGVSFKKNKNNRFEITIYDTGIGIPEDKLTLIFDNFRQGNQEDTRSYAGIGAGLSICKGLVANAKGSIWAESTISKGSKICISFPIIKQ